MADISLLDGKISGNIIKKKVGLKKLGNIVRHEKVKDTEIFTCQTGGILTLKILAPYLIHIQMNPMGNFIEGQEDDYNGPYMIEKNEWDGCTYRVEENTTSYQLTTDLIKVEVTKEPLTIKVYDNDGRVVFKERSSITYNWGEVITKIDKDDNEHLYGLGLRREYPLNNQEFYHEIRRNTWFGKSVPFYMSTRGYGLFFNTTLWKTHFDFGSDNVHEVAVTIPQSDRLDYYFIYGPDFSNIMNGYTQITGKTVMPPKWSLGYWHGKYSFCVREEVEYVAETFREKDIPCDLIFQDNYWRGAKQAAEIVPMKWDYDSFPEPAKMIEKLHNMGFHYFSHVNTSCLPYAKDFTNPDHVKEWNDNIEPLLDDGVDGFMIDGGEGEGRNENFMNWNIPGGKFANGMRPEEMANLWGQLYNKTVVETMRKYRPNERQIGLIRAGTSGIQRYGVIWSGDHDVSFEALAQEMAAGMNMSMSGMPFWTFDIGGITGRPSKELFIRWLQVGCFVPVTRTHGRNEREPWLFGQQAVQIIRKYLKLRMRLLPYIYSHVYKMHQQNIPLVKPLVWEYPEDIQTRGMWDQWLFGSDIMVAPIYKKGHTSRSVYLPEGEWIDFWTGNCYKGRQNIHYDAPIDVIPLFVRGGAIIPMGCEMNYVGEKPNYHLEWVITPSKTSSFDLYDDDGKSYDFEAGINTKIAISCKSTPSDITISIDRKIGTYIPEYKTYTFKVRCNDTKKVYINNHLIEDWEIAGHDTIIKVICNHDTSTVIQLLR